MNQHNIQYFLTAVEEQSFSRTARKYYVSQAAVTQQIASIEKELQTVLFIRKNNGIEVTEAGLYFYEKIKKLLEEYREISGNLRRFREEKPETLLIGVSTLQEYEWLIPCLKKFSETDKRTGFQVRAGSPGQLRDMLKNGKLSFFLSDNPIFAEEDGLEALPAYCTGISIIAGTGSPLFDKEEIGIEDLKGIPLILAEAERRDTEWCDFEFYRFCRSAGFVPEVSGHAASFLEAVILADEGKGVVVYMEDISGRYRESPFRKIRQLKVSVCMQKFLIHRRKEENPDLLRLLKYLSGAERSHQKIGRADLKSDFGVLWKEALKQEDGSYSRRLLDDTAEIDFWHRFMEKKSIYRQDPWAVRMSGVVTELIRDMRPESILEIGPGWGNYTMDLASICDEMYCLDLSPDVLDYIKLWAKKLNKPEIRTILSKWEDYEEDRTYDIIFAYNCFYRMLHLRECLEKMNRMAGKLCIIGMGLGEVENYYREMEKALQVRLAYDKKDYIYFINILYQMGIDANIQIIPLSKDITFQTWEQVVQYGTSCLYERQAEMNSHGPEIENILKKYFLRKRDGSYHYRYDYRGTLIYWKPAG